MSLARGLGLAALMIAWVGAFVPFLGLFIGWGALAIATIAALAGDRGHTIATVVFSAFVFLFLTPMLWLDALGSAEGTAHLLGISILMLLAPIGAMIMNATGKLAIGRRAREERGELPPPNARAPSEPVDRSESPPVDGQTPAEYAVSKHRAPERKDELVSGFNELHRRGVAVTNPRQKMLVLAIAISIIAFFGYMWSNRDVQPHGEKLANTTTQLAVVTRQAINTSVTLRLAPGETAPWTMLTPGVCMWTDNADGAEIWLAGADRKPWRHFGGKATFLYFTYRASPDRAARPSYHFSAC